MYIMTSEPPPRAAPLAHALTALPAHAINGLSVALGLVVVGAGAGLAGGLHAALAVSAGAAAVSVPDTPIAPRAKLAQMLPAWISATLSAALVLGAHGAPLAVGAVVVLVAAVSVAWLAYGPRGGPQGFVPVLMLIFQMSVLHDGSGDDRWAMLGWAMLGGGLYLLWSLASSRVLAARYRRLALASCLDAVAGVTRAQAAYTADRAAGLADRASTDALLPLARRQAAMAEVLQGARDFLYDLPDGHRDAPLVAALLHVIELRDQLLACQLDLDAVAQDRAGRRQLPRLAEALDALATQLAGQARALRHDIAPPAALDFDAAVRVLEPDAADPSQSAALRGSLAARLRLVDSEQAQLSAALRPGSVPAAMPLGADLRESFLSPRDWPLPPLRALLRPYSPLRRYALRAMAAFGAAYAIALALPWVSYKHWVLLTVAVVLRGSLEQTLSRRNARVLGTLAGCLIAGVLFAFSPSQAVLLGVTALSIAVAHAFVQADYRLTATASAVMGLSQSHLWAGAQAFAVPERLADTLVGASLAWAFCYFLPSWERQLLPTLTARLLNAQADYVHHALTLPARHGAERGWRLARREVYDVLWMLAQTLQRASREPRSVRPALPAVDALLLRGHRLTSQLAALRGLLVQEHGRLDPARAEPALLAAKARLVALLHGGAGPAPGAPPDVDRGEEVGERPPATVVDPLPLLLRRLSQAEREAAALARAAAALSGSP
jgi:uncharacterized membrane protein YccC